MLALRAPSESRDGVPPLAVKFVEESPKSNSSKKRPDRPKPPKVALAKGSIAPEWLDLQQHVSKQREKPGRIPLPSREEVVKRLGGPDNPGAWQAGIRWSRACFGYQPELTGAWFDTTGAFGKEAGFDPVFSSSLFWVITQSLQCFY